LSYHWGDEYSFVQSADRARFSRQLVDAGVDIIWGNHPHVLQAWYLLDSKRGQALVMPSLGNFISAQSWGVGPGRMGSIDAAKGNSVLFKVGVDWDAGQRIRFDELNPVLIANWQNSQGQMVVRTLADLLATEKGDWLTFWKYRSAVMTDFIQNSAQAGKIYGLPSD
jgi:poly-gamma-glutamate synthesis protein (capsule biosynthesis protein)